MCNCRKGKGAAARYIVTYPNGSTDSKTSEVAAKLAVGRVPGAKYEPAPASASA